MSFALLHHQYFTHSFSVIQFVFPSDVRRHPQTRIFSTANLKYKIDANYKNKIVLIYFFNFVCDINL